MKITPRMLSHCSTWRHCVKIWVDLMRSIPPNWRNCVAPSPHLRPHSRGRPPHERSSSGHSSHSHRLVGSDLRDPLALTGMWGEMNLLPGKFFPNLSLSSGLLLSEPPNFSLVTSSEIVCSFAGPWQLLGQGVSSGTPGRIDMRAGPLDRCRHRTTMTSGTRMWPVSWTNCTTKIPRLQLLTT